MEPQKDPSIYGAFGSTLFVFGRANGETAIDFQWIWVIFENLAVLALPLKSNNASATDKTVDAFGSNI